MLFTTHVFGQLSANCPSLSVYLISTSIDRVGKAEKLEVTYMERLAKSDSWIQFEDFGGHPIGFDNILDRKVSYICCIFYVASAACGSNQLPKNISLSAILR